MSQHRKSRPADDPSHAFCPVTVKRKSLKIRMYLYSPKPVVYEMTYVFFNVGTIRMECSESGEETFMGSYFIGNEIIYRPDLIGIRGNRMNKVMDASYLFSILYQTVRHTV